MSRITTVHNPLEFFIIFWMFIHVVVVATVVSWPPESLVSWVISGVAAFFALYFDLGLLYIYLTDKTEANSSRENGEKSG